MESDANWGKVYSHNLADHNRMQWGDNFWKNLGIAIAVMLTLFTTYQATMKIRKTMSMNKIRKAIERRKNSDREKENPMLRRRANTTASYHTRRNSEGKRDTQTRRPETTECVVIFSDNTQQQSRQKKKAPQPKLSRQHHLTLRCIFKSIINVVKLT